VNIEKIKYLYIDDNQNLNLEENRILTACSNYKYLNLSILSIFNKKGIDDKDIQNKIVLKSNRIWIIYLEVKI